MRMFSCRSGFLPKSTAVKERSLRLMNSLGEACIASLESHDRNDLTRVDDYERNSCTRTGSMSKGKQFKEVINCSLGARLH